MSILSNGIFFTVQLNSSCHDIRHGHIHHACQTDQGRRCRVPKLVAAMTIRRCSARRASISTSSWFRSSSWRSLLLQVSTAAYRVYLIYEDDAETWLYLDQTVPDPLASPTYISSNSEPEAERAVASPAMAQASRVLPGVLVVG
jgi:hypothetical protein